MGKKLSQKERVAYIRKGNELFNKGKYKEAETVFMLTDYRDGILRIANRYYYELKKPLVALKYYYKINAKEKVEEIKERMIFALKKLLSKEQNTKNNNLEQLDNQSPEEKTENDQPSDEEPKTDEESLGESPVEETESGIFPDEISK